ncbi:conserved hypothetical protein [Desulfovibrionales bacterium]
MPNIASLGVGQSQLEDNMRIVVFDFDGTLIDSNRLKYNAYFAIFPKNIRYHRTIKSVLADFFEATRYAIIHCILERLGEADDSGGRVSTLAQSYNDIVVAGAKTCPELPGASDILAQLSGHYVLYLNSTTPETALREIVTHRGWTKYFRGIFGYPTTKLDTMRAILATERIEPVETILVGDGQNDRHVAAAVGCRFMHADGRPLTELLTV